MHLLAESWKRLQEAGNLTEEQDCPPSTRKWAMQSINMRSSHTRLLKRTCALAMVPNAENLEDHCLIQTLKGPAFQARRAVEAFEKVGDKGHFQYGLFDLWEFYCELVEIVDEKNAVNYPFTSFRFGSVPLKAPSKSGSGRKSVVPSLDDDEEDFNFDDDLGDSDFSDEDDDNFGDEEPLDYADDSYTDDED